MYISDNYNFAALQHGQENDPVFAFSLWYLAPRSLALEVFKSPILLVLQLLQRVMPGSLFALSLVLSVSPQFQNVARTADLELEIIQEDIVIKKMSPHCVAH